MFPELQAFVPNSEIHTLTQRPPPKFGHALKEYFALDPDYVNLNHGTSVFLLLSLTAFV